jgi:class I fructose-bisphosphate aldolase
MDSRTGKKIRMGCLFNQTSGHTLIVAYSHGVLVGPKPGMRTLAEMQRVSQSVAGADGLLVTPGMLPQLEDAFLGRDKPSLLVHMDYQSFSRSILSHEAGTTVELAAVEDVMAAGADAIMTYLYIGYDDPEREKMEIQRNARLARSCDRWGLPLMIEPLSARDNSHPEDRNDVEIVSLYCRIAAEIGADMIKCNYPGSTEALAEVVSSCPAPVLVAGGPKDKDPEAAYLRARNAIDAGAKGLVFGRNIFAADDPAAEVERFQKIIHREGS